MAYVEIYTSKKDYTSLLSVGKDLGVNCGYVTWLWSAYELLGIDINQCLINEENLLMKYVNTSKRLRVEQSDNLLSELRKELMEIRERIRTKCDDELVCLANRLYEYKRAVNILYNYYLRINELGNEDLSKLTVALIRYNMPLLGLEVYGRLLSSLINDELVYLTFLSMLSPIKWLSHITMDIKILPYLNWVLMYIKNHYVIIIMSLGRAYVISDLNININGGRVVHSNDWEFKSVFEDHVVTQLESKDGHGLLFMGNWDDYAIKFALDLKPREGSIKGLFLDLNISQLIPTIIPPHDYISIKYSV
nr:MAG: hypothetical protein TU36_05520 [Vulcanisaeta sp. AZ3]